MKGHRPELDPSAFLHLLPAGVLVPLTLAWLGCSTDPAGPGQMPGNGDLALAVEPIVDGLTIPVHLTAPRADDRLFVVEKVGRIRIIEDGALLDEPFLDISGLVSGGSEQGLFSLAFHPDYAANGLLFVSYTALAGDTRIDRYRASGDPNRADPGSAKLILFVDQPADNHNGGLIAFGPDGMLYIGLGDGGGAGDTFQNGQDLGSLHGAMLRIDVDAGDPYAIPPDNPFVGQQDARDEIWAYGLRNPWRWAFDRPGGLLYLADVGQSEREEVNAVSATAAGVNYGWNILEGTRCFAAANCDTAGLTLPVLEYDQSQGCSVTGGFVYRGDAIPELRGTYLYSDYCSGFLRGFRLDGGNATDRRSYPVGPLGGVTSFGEDSAGELYILSDTGRVQRIVAGS